MSSTRIAGAAAAIVLSLSVAGVARAQSPARPQNVTRTGPVTVVGCLIKESDYRKTHNIGPGEFNGAGMGDEFVLVNATTNPPAGAAVAASSTPCTETGGEAYRVTGHREEELKPFVGKRMEIAGTWEKETYNASSNSKLPQEVEMTSFREVTATAVAAPPPPPSMDAREPAPMRSGSMSSPPAPERVPAPAPRSKLPHTASPEVLIGLIGVVSLASGAMLFRRRAA